MKRHWTTDELIQNFTLRSDELAFLTSATDHNRLGFSVLFKFFEHEGRFPQAHTQVPDDIIRYLAEQLSVQPEVFHQYNFKGRSIRQHRARIRQWFNFRPYVEDDRQPLINWLIEALLPENQKLEFLIDAILKHLQAKHIEPPSAASIERIISSAIHTYETQLFLEICDKLPIDTHVALDSLLKPIESSTADDAIVNIPLYQIRTLKVKSSLNSVLQAATQLQRLQQLNLPADLFSSISPKVVQRFKQRAAVEAKSQLYRHADQIRYTLLAAFCLCRQAEITDELIESLILLVHKMGAKAERKVIKELVEDIKRVGGKHSLLFAIAEVALSNPDGTVKEVIYPVASEQTLKDLVLESRSSGPTYRYHIHTMMRNSYSKHYRRMVPILLRVLDFRTNNTVYQPVIEAIQLLKDYLDSLKIYYPTDEVVPLDGVVRPLLSPVVVEYNQNGEQRVNRINYEMCVLSSLRDHLRNKSIWVVGANHYRNPDEDLPTDFEEKRDTYYQALGMPLLAKTFTDQLQQEMHNALRMLDKNLPNNDKVKIKDRNGGFLSITPLKAQPEPRNLTHLKAEISRFWPMTGLLDILKETDLRVNFTHYFTGVGTREVLSRETLQRRLLLCLYGLGTNMGIKRVSNMTKDTEQGEQYGDLYYVYQRYLHKEALRQAIAAIVNDTFRIRHSHIWGEGTTACASDARKFAAWDGNLLTEWHIRYHGRGVMVYWHVERNSACIYSQLKSCSSSEVAAMIEGVLRHCTDMEVEKNYVDTRGQSEVGFAFCHLLGFQLLPRLKGIGRQRLYRPEKGTPYAYPNLQLILTRPINWELIQKYYDEMIKYATALRLGTAEADAILQRFTRNQPQHPIYSALAELGKVVKTIFLCHYLTSEELRREIYEGLNVIENWNSTNDFILYGKGSEISSNRLQNQELTVLSMHLLLASLVYINTLMIQYVLAQPGWFQQMTEADWRGLTPLIYQHINPYGTFELNLEQRLPFLEE
jgi:TnpA family transposase